MVATINDPATRKRLVDFGIEPVGNSPAEYAEMLKGERARWQKLITDLKITLD
ncbi:Tripartite tricarboxylate transporter family receptor [compost metagenome]